MVKKRLKSTIKYIYKSRFLQFVRQYYEIFIKNLSKKLNDSNRY